MVGGSTPESNPIDAKPGQMQLGVDPGALRAGSQRMLDPTRLAAQKELLRAGTARHTPIMVTQEGVVADGHHTVRAAIEMGRTVDVQVVDLELPAGGAVADLPLRGR